VLACFAPLAPRDIAARRRAATSNASNADGRSDAYRKMCALGDENARASKIGGRIASCRGQARGQARRTAQKRQQRLSAWRQRHQQNSLWRR